MMTFPGPRTLGRGLVVAPGDPIPDQAQDWLSLKVDGETLNDPAQALDLLGRWWHQRIPSVIVLVVPFRELKEPEKVPLAPYLLAPDFELTRERLHFLVWINRYDGRGGRIRWHHAERALAAGADPCPDGSGDVMVAGTPVWIDGGRRGSPVAGLGVVHAETVWSGRLELENGAVLTTEMAPDQETAVSHLAGAARVAAPAGSGKTRVLTERMRHVLADRRWGPETVTALAYNRRAAEDMAKRLTPALNPHVRTLHAIGYEIVGKANGRRPRLLGEPEARRLLELLAPVRPRANEDVYAPYLEALSEIRITLRSPQEVAAVRDDVPGLVGLFPLYREEMARRSAIDHDEQIYRALEILLTDPDIRSWAQARYRQHTVHELQDLCPAHLLMVRLLAAPGYDVFGVGDDDQLIYGYAGASPEYLLDFDRFFPGAAHYLLEVNYRCPGGVVESAVNLLSHNRRRIEKRIRARSESMTGPEVIVAPETELGEHLAIVVGELVRQSGPEQLAILARVNVGLLVPQVTLRDAGQATETALDESLLSRSGVASALAWLRVAEAAAREAPMKGVDLSQVIRRPGRSMAPGVRSALGKGSWSLERLASFADGSTDDRTHRSLRGLVEDIFSLATQIRRRAPVSEQLTLLRDRIGLGASLDRLDNSRARPTGGHSDDIDALIMLAYAHGEVTDFEEWLRASLGGTAPPGPVVSLSTVHRVKGLEWRHVVVWDVSDGVMPHRLATDIEEERRILHVAITRCSESVTLIAREGAPSPFIPELSEPAPGWDQATTATPTSSTSASGS